MPSATTTKEELQRLIREHKLQQALDLLLDFFKEKDQDLVNYILSLSIQLRRCEDNGGLGIIPSTEETDAILTRISSITRYIISRISEGDIAYLPEEERKNIEFQIDGIKFSIDSHLEAFKKRKKRLGDQIEQNRKAGRDVDSYINELREINEDVLSKARKRLDCVKFVNRNEEKKNIKEPQYSLIDAPAGYGKTELIEKVRNEYNGGEYIEAFVQIDYKDSLSKIFIKFADALKLSFHPNISINENEFCEHLTEKLLQERRKEIIWKNLVMFIDFNGKPSSYFLFLKDKVVPALYEAINPHINLYKYPERFKIIYAGRYLSKYVKPPIKEILLSDFDFNTIAEAVKHHKWYGNWDKSFRKSTAAHILYLTGGHPLCISQALCASRYRSPLHFLSNDRKINRLIDLVAESIEYEFLSTPSWNFPILKACSVFRRISWSILEKLKDGLFNLHNLETGDIEEMLLSSYLWSLDPRDEALHDGIARKILSINLRHNDPTKYKEYCAFAKESCFERINTTREIIRPHRWLIEYLFQSLQIHALEINDSIQRARIKEDFYHPSGDFIKGVAEFRKTIKPEQLNKKIAMLINDINSDKEFQFTVKYYLREQDDIYNDNPLEELRERINEELRK